MSEKFVRLNNRISAAPVPFTGGMYLIPTHVFIVEGPGGLLVIDTGGAGSGRVIMKLVAFLGYSASDISAIALSHWHRDHTGGLAELIALLPEDRCIPVYMGMEDIAIFQAQAWRLLKFHPGLKIPFPHRPGLMPGGTGTRFKLLPMNAGNEHLKNGWSITALHTPGHTPGHHSFLHAETDSLLAGCALALLSRRTAGITPVFDNRKAQCESAQRLSHMEFTQMFPIHFYLNTEPVPLGRRITCSTRSIRSFITGSKPFFRYP